MAGLALIADRRCATTNDGTSRPSSPSSPCHIYAVGTAPAQAVPVGQRPTLRSTDFVVAWSDDDGQGWQKKALPIDVPADAPTRSGSVVTTEVASGPKGTVAVAAVRAELDVPAALPDGATAPYGWATTDTGVDILGPEKDDVCPAGTSPSKSPPNTMPVGETFPTYCHSGGEADAPVVVTPQDARGVEASYTWEQLGVTGDLLRAVRREPIAFFAPHGSTDFERVDLAAPALSGPGVSVQARDDGFDVLLSRFSRYGGGPEQFVLLQSTDGRSWVKAEIPAERPWSGSLGTVAGGTAFVTANEQSASFVLADGQGGWRTMAPEGAVDHAAAEGRKMSVGAVAFGDFGVVVHAIFMPARDDFDERDVRHRLLVSRDGVAWDDVPLDEVIGDARGYVSRITITGEEIVVTVSLPTPDNADNRRRQAVYIGSVA